VVINLDGKKLNSVYGQSVEIIVEKVEVFSARLQLFIKFSWNLSLNLNLPEKWIIH